MSLSKHDQVAQYLAKKFQTKYKSDKGIDLVTKNRAIEVETKVSGIDQGISQVEHSSKARYLAVPKSIEDKTLAKTLGTGIGVMSEHGKVVKKAGRR